MDKLWAPWRIKYIRSAAIKRNSFVKKCVFCESIKSKRKNYVIFKTKRSFSVLNVFPYNNGHMMIVPIRHVPELLQLKECEALDLFRSLNMAKKLLDKVLKPDGYNIGINISRSAGAGVTSHLHIHIVPRWIGDTNFMPVLFNTKVISQSLDELYKKLKNVYAKTN